MAKKIKKYSGDEIKIADGRKNNGGKRENSGRPKKKIPTIKVLCTFNKKEWMYIKSKIGKKESHERIKKFINSEYERILNFTTNDFIQLEVTNGNIIR